MEGPTSVNPWIALGLMAASGVMAVLAADARVAVAAMAGLYAGIGLLLSFFGVGSPAWLHIVVGGLACLILYLGLRGQPKPRKDQPLVSLPFRIMALLLSLVAAGVLHTRVLPYTGGLTSLICFALAGLFVAQVGLHRAPIRAAMGVLTLMNAVSLFVYNAAGGVFLTAWALAAHLMVALAAGHLQSTWATRDGEEA